jgi:hypothetical protein
MSDPSPAEDRDAQSEAHQTIASPAEENQRLREQLSDERFARELREVFSLATTAGTVAAPVAHSRLLEMIVQTAAHVISAQAASLFLLDEVAGELVL